MNDTLFWIVIVLVVVWPFVSLIRVMFQNIVAQLVDNSCNGDCEQGRKPCTCKK